MKRIYTVFHFLCCIALLALPALAAAQQGKLSGEVRDPHQATVVGAKVTAVNLSNKQTFSAKSDAHGGYSFEDLPAGVYDLTIEAPGFKPVKLSGVAIKDIAMAIKNVQLELAGNVESVIVNGLALDTNPKTQQQAVLLDLPEGLQGDNIVFTAKDIEAMHPVSLVDVLQSVPGIGMSFQGRQHMDFGSMRGGAFQIILDGVYVAQADRILAMIPVQIVETMTIVHDSTALSIGPLLSYHTMGGSGSDVSNQGFVIIRTKRSSQAEAGVVSSGSTWATALGHGYAGSKSGKWDYRGAYTYATSAGRDGWNMGYRNGSATFHGGYSSPGLTLDFLYYGSRGYRSFEYGEWLTASSYNASTKKDSCSPTAVYGQLCATTMNMYKNDGDLYALNVVRHWNDNNRTTLQYGFANLHINAGTAAAGNIANEQDSTSANLLLKHTVLLKGNAITAGGQYMKYIAPLGAAPTSGVTNDRLDDTMVSWFVQDEYRLLDNRLIMDGGYRADKLHNGWSITNNAKVDQWNPAFNTIAFGANYKFTPKFDVTGRYGYLQYLPPTNDVMPNTATTNSSALPSESQNRGELSFNYVANPHVKPNVVFYTYATNNYPASSTACYNPVTGKTGSSSWTDSTSGNEIDCVLPSAVKTAGTEVKLSGLLYGPFSYSAGYGYVSTDNTASNKTMSHNFVNAGLNFRQNNWFANLNMVYNGPLWSSSSPGGTYYGELANFNREDLNAGYNLKLWEKAMTFTAFCRNLGNSDYATRYVTGAYRDPGRSVGVELAAKFF